MAKSSSRSSRGPRRRSRAKAVRVAAARSAAATRTAHPASLTAALALEVSLKTEILSGKQFQSAVTVVDLL